MISPAKNIVYLLLYLSSKINEILNLTYPNEPYYNDIFFPPFRDTEQFVQQRDTFNHVPCISRLSPIGLKNEHKKPVYRDSPWWSTHAAPHPRQIDLPFLTLAS